MLHPVNKFQRRSPPHEAPKHVQVARGIMRPRTHDIDLVGHEVIERHAVEPRKLSSLVERWRPLAELPIAYRLPRYPDGCGDLLLAHSRTPPQPRQFVVNHRSPLPKLACSPIVANGAGLA